MRRFCLAVILLMPELVIATPVQQVAASATRLLMSFDEHQRSIAFYEFESSDRFDWHFFPKSNRKGLPFKQMSSAQRTLSQAMLKASLSQVGYAQAGAVIELEGILGQLEFSAGENDALAYRDPGLYYITIFGSPDDNAWGWSIEGHHLSLNFTITDGRIVADTPSFHGANPHTVPHGARKGWRVLGEEEDYARILLRMFDGRQRDVAVISSRAGGLETDAKQQVAPSRPQGIKMSDLTDDQREYLVALIMVYAQNSSDDVAGERLRQIQDAGDEIYFAWMGPTDPGYPHGYRVQSPTFLIEYDNTQGGGNHAHTVWRDFDGDFGRDVIGDHKRADAH